MSPQYEAHVAGPHAHVACAACHIGEGASAHVLAKLRGLQLVWAVLNDSYETPVRAVASRAEPMRERCERCHDIKKLPATRLLQVPRYPYNAASPIQLLTMTLKMGTNHGRLDETPGIGWHMARQARISFAAADPQSRDIPWIRVQRSDGSEATYISAGSKLDTRKLEELPRRLMDCADCHNRTAHDFPLPDPELDQAMRSGELSSTLPGLKRLLLDGLAREYPNAAAARSAIHEHLTQAYQRSHPALLLRHRAEIEQAAEFAVRLHARGNHQEQRISWGAYANHLGHRFSTGCFRCHDGKHVTSAGKVLPNDCDRSCHTAPSMGPLLANGSVGQNGTGTWHPWKIPNLDPKIPGHDNLQCADCHAAGRLPKQSCNDCHRSPGI